MNRLIWTYTICAGIRTSLQGRKGKHRYPRVIRLFEAVHDNSYQKTVRLSKTRISLHATEFSIIGMSLIWAYQRAPPDQRVTSEDSDLVSLINTD